MDWQRRLDDRITAWRVVVDRVAETESSVVAFGRRGNQPVVVKLAKDNSDEWNSGEILDAFEGRGTARVHDYIDGALLLERLTPGTDLVSLTLSGRDAEATVILAGIVGEMSPAPAPQTTPRVRDWARSFGCYAARADSQIPECLVVDAQNVYAELCDSQSRVRLLHGDLHHYNVLFDDARGWVAIDPKGVIGELEFEVGAVLRNPYEHPAIFADPAVIEKRIDHFAGALRLDAARILGWGFAQAVLSAVWSVEDGLTLAHDCPPIAFAQTTRPMLSRRI